MPEREFIVIEAGEADTFERVKFYKKDARSAEGVTFTLHGEQLTLRLTRADPDDTGKIREYDPNQPVALDDRDPGNTSPDTLTQPLDPADDVYTLVHPDK